jgi:hypothetical protein
MDVFSSEKCFEIKGESCGWTILLPQQCRSFAFAQVEKPERNSITEERMQSG